jgi:hypothetical protein
MDVNLNDKDKEELIRRVKDRKIKRLVHFTSINNLTSIFNHGLLPIATLSERQIGYYYNDQYRIDNCLDASCLSISRPNYGLLTRCKKNCKPGIDLVILVIKREILWRKDCAFCTENAASNNVNKVPLSERKGTQAFDQLFRKYEGKPLRRQLRLKRAETTHPQAEVLVFGEIETRFIRGVIFECDTIKSRYIHLIPKDVSIHVRKDYFEPRRDYAHWKKNGGYYGE